MRPAGPHWLAELNLINRDEGPWDKGRLPLASIRGLVEYGDGRLRIESLNAEAAGGRMRLQARLADTRTLSATAGWQGQLQVQGVELSRSTASLDPVRLDGSECRGRRGRRGLRCGAAAGSRTGADIPPARSAAAKCRRQGRWAAGWLRVEKLDIRTRDARLDGRIDSSTWTRAARSR